MKKKDKVFRELRNYLDSAKTYGEIGDILREMIIIILTQVDNLVPLAEEGLISLAGDDQQYDE